jgi:hypothetical protein
MNYKYKYEKYKSKYILLKNNKKGGSNLQSEIPRNIYMFWHKKKDVPNFVKKCIKNIKEKNRNYKVRIYYYNDVMRIKDRPKILETYRKRGVADWLRLYLLYKYGGIWIDASSVFIKKSLDDIIDLKSNKLLGYNPPWDNSKILENWFLASKINNKFVKMWLDEWEIALESKENYCKKYNGFAGPILKTMLPYLTQHLAFTKLLKTKEISNYYESLGNSESKGNPFYYHKLYNWNNKKFANEMLYLKNIDKNISFLKLRGVERYSIIKEIENCNYSNDSHLVKLLQINCIKKA